MADCYHCGQTGSSYRRNVTTGGSKGTYYGRKSITFSTRTYNGLRSLCANCAYNVDKSNIKSGIIGRYLILCIIVFLILIYKF